MRQARLLPDAKSRAIAGRIVPEERLHQGAAARLSGASRMINSKRNALFMCDPPNEDKDSADCALRDWHYIPQLD